MDIFYKLYDNCIKKYVKKLDISTNAEEFRSNWMRGDILENPSYTLHVDGSDIFLGQFLLNPNSVTRNILIITGEPHIGKAAFIDRLLFECRRDVLKKQHLVSTKSLDKPFRIPVCFPHELYAQLQNPSSLGHIIKSIISGDKGIDQHLLNHSIDTLLDQGRFLIYLDGKDWLADPSEDLKRVLSLEKQMGARNQFILKTRDSMEIQQAFLSTQTYITFYLDKLTEAEVIHYLQVHHNDLLHIVEGNKSLIEILRYPEHLEMFGRFPEGELVKQIGIKKIENDFDFYEFFIRANIQKKLNESDAHRNGSSAAQKGREQAVYAALKQHAIHIYLGGPPCNHDPSQYFSFSQFREISLLNAEDNFVFPLCGYYLAAKGLSEIIVQKTEISQPVTIPKTLLEEPLETILILTSRLLKDLESREALWQCLSTMPECKRLLLSKIAQEMEYKEFFYDKALQTLECDFYDCTVLEALNELGDEGVKYVQHKYYKLGGDNDPVKNNVRKRIVYFLGISHSGIIQSMLDELTKENIDTHLKYHIIRAAVENYGIHPNSTEYINHKFSMLMSYCSTTGDPIIKSDFCVLYFKKNSRPWLADSDTIILHNQLKEKLSDPVYWVRAHAAGAIGRHATLETGNSLDSETLLLQCVEQELSRIYNQIGDYSNSIKVISYSVEALCELSDTTEQNGYRALGVMCQLIGLIELNCLGNQYVEDAYATIATGIEYMANFDTGKLPFNLGGRFRNHSISYKKVLRNAFRAFKQLAEELGEVPEEIIMKIECLDQIIASEESEMHDTVYDSDIIRVLQMSDWHYEGPNSDNNLILQAIERDFCGKVDMLVITGDLRQYGRKYDDSLTILKELTSNLNLNPEDVFMVPGNHDCGDYPEKESTIKDIRDHIDADKDYCSEHMNVLLKGFQEYESFLKEFYSEALLAQGGIHNCLLSWRNRLRILCINTAILCDGDTERKKLVDIGSLTQIRQTDGPPTICIAHHNLSQLYYEHQQTIRTVFDNLKISALLSGDIHQPDQQSIRQNNRDIPNYICGKFFGKTSDKWSSRIILLLEIDEKKSVMTPHYYKWNGSRFQPDHSLDRVPEDGLQGDWMPESLPLRK